MGLIEDARRLAGSSPPVDHFDDCWFCDVSQRGEAAHDADCPWLSMPRIVAALEAAELVIECGPAQDSKDFGFCPCCIDFYDGEEYPPGLPPRHVVKPHADDCVWQGLVAALHGEATDDEWKTGLLNYGIPRR